MGLKKFRRVIQKGHVPPCPICGNESIQTTEKGAKDTKDGSESYSYKCTHEKCDLKPGFVYVAPYKVVLRKLNKTIIGSALVIITAISVAYKDKIIEYITPPPKMIRNGTSKVDDKERDKLAYRFFLVNFQNKMSAKSTSDKQSMESTSRDSLAVEISDDLRELLSESKCPELKAQDMFRGLKAESECSVDFFDKLGDKKNTVDYCFSGQLIDHPERSKDKYKNQYRLSLVGITSREGSFLKKGDFLIEKTDWDEGLRTLVLKICHNIGNSLDQYELE